jgi:pyridoxal phosphate enzyme (YggS family)
VAVTEEVAARLAAVRQAIAEACARSGRRPEEVVLVGASKVQPVAVLRAAWEAGLRVFGENRVQEAAAKRPELPAAIDWHLIGPLQSNKVKQALDLFSTVHSVDRPKIAQALDREAAERGCRLTGFLEVNLGDEASKHGFPADELAEAVRPLAGLAHLTIVGLMAIPPLGGEPEASRPWFRRLRGLRDELARRPEWRGFPGLLSMGMSNDFAVAVEEGATHVRVGTALFGKRAKPVGSEPPSDLPEAG